VFVIIGLGVVLVSVLGGFLLEGGNFLVLMQWAEFMIIGGAAVGALLVATPKATLSKMVKYVLGSVKSQDVSKASFQELLQLLYEIFQTARVKGLLTLEQHVEKPEESELFAKYPAFLKNHHTLEFLVDSLKLMVVGGVPPLELESLLESDLETQEEEGKRRPGLRGGPQGGRGPGGHLFGGAHVLWLRPTPERPDRASGGPGGTLYALHQGRGGGLRQGYAPHRGCGVRPPGHCQRLPPDLCRSGGRLPGHQGEGLIMTGILDDGLTDIIWE
jgi:hypothetical protein